MAQLTQLETRAPGEMIVEQWDAALDFYVIVDGDVEVLIDEAAVNRLSEGEFFGELAALDWGGGFGYPRIASVRALTDVTLLTFPAGALNELAREHPQIAGEIRRVGTARLHGRRRAVTASRARGRCGSAVPCIFWAIVGAFFWFGADDPDAEERTSCSHAGAPTNILTVKVEGDSTGEIIRRGRRIDVSGGDGSRRTCAGRTPTVRNTDTISIVLVGVSFIDVDLGGGPFAPGVTPESEGAPEIEFHVSSDLGAAEIYGTEAADVWHWGPGGAAPGLNLNPGRAGDTDVDVITVGDEDDYDGLWANGAGGNDTIVGASGRFSGAS